MKKIIAIFFCFAAFVCVVFLAGCGETNSLTNYEIVLTYDDETKSAQATTTVDYFNASNNALSCVKFHLYPNAFSEKGDGMVVNAASVAKAYPNGKSYGGAEVSSVKVGGNAADWTYEGDADTFLCVSLTEKLFPDERVKIEISYSLTVPNTNHRFGWGENAVNFANFYPIACTYREGDGFCTDDYMANGDPFYSDVANYSVTICCPKNMTLAVGGDSALTHENGEIQTTTYTSKKVRDVAFVLSQNFNLASAKAGKTSVDYYFYDDDEAEASLQIAVEAVEFFSEKFGEYPYSNLAVVQTNFVHGGMEYPRLVMISDAVNGEDYGYVIVHEIAHQWWYGVVGNDEYNEPWLDESLTEYSTALFYENHDEYDIRYESIINGANDTYKFFLKIYSSVVGEVDTSMNRAINEYATEPEYVNNIYTRGIIMFDALREVIGERKFYACLQSYYDNFAYKNAMAEDFISTFCDKSHINLNGFFDSWLGGKVEFVLE